MNLDIAILGGGIAGLWLLATLRERGYGALLIEKAQLGGGQTLCAQGIIHGGAKYRLGGVVGATADAVSAMPERWRNCLRGTGAVDLRAATLLADHHYLWATPSLLSRCTSLVASKLLGSHAVDALPPALRHPQFRGRLYRLDEPIFALHSVVSVLATRYQHAIVQGTVQLTADGRLHLQHPQRAPLLLHPQLTIYSAGAGNAACPGVQQQLRPLHMVLVRGALLPGALYAHCIGASSVPRLTITSHYDAHGKLLWYLGGGLAESGVGRSREQQIHRARCELQQLLPWLDWNAAQFASFHIERAEAQQPNGARPASFNIYRAPRGLVAWPTKLALAPLLADAIAANLADLGINANGVDWNVLASWPRPPVAAYPWDREELQWS